MYPDKEELYAKMDIEIRKMTEAIERIHKKAGENAWTLEAEIEDTIIEIEKSMLGIKYLGGILWE